MSATAPRTTESATRARFRVLLVVLLVRDVRRPGVLPAGLPLPRGVMHPGVKRIGVAPCRAAADREMRGAQRNLYEPRVGARKRGNGRWESAVLAPACGRSDDISRRS